MTPAETCAAAIAPLVGNELAITFVAIAGCESSFGTNNQGDSGLGSPNCQGYTSFGAWQINLPAHAGYLQSVTGSPNPCTWAQWLLNLHNNAVAAKHVFDRAGGSFHPWTTYNTGCYQHWRSTATQAVNNLNHSTPSTASSGPPVPTETGMGPLFLLGGAVIGLLVLEDTLKAVKAVG